MVFDPLSILDNISEQKHFKANHSVSVKGWGCYDLTYVVKTVIEFPT